jgi:hypothetical protein
MRTDPGLFERIITGEANALTAALRGRLRIEGDPRLLVAIKSLLPGPPHRTTAVPAPGGGEAATRRGGEWATHGAAEKDRENQGPDEGGRTHD